MTIRPCPNPNRHCKYFYSPTQEALKGKQGHGCFADDHHEYHPEADYQQDPIEKRWRELGRNIVNLCRREHDMEHRLEPPEKPPKDEMVADLIESDEHLSETVVRAIKNHLEHADRQRYD